jgi:uncharacterized membrane protein (DUF4010 family)
MVEVVFLEGLVISMLVGALLGLEREYSKRQSVIGLRSFSLAALFGFLSVVLSKLLNNNLIVFLAFIFLAAFTVIIYYTSAKRGSNIGFTTSISLVITFMLGIFVGFGWRTEAIFLGVLISIILFSKERMHQLVSRLNQKEIGDLLEFLVLLGIIYPLLPSSFELFGVNVQPLMIWGIIVMISVLNFCVFMGARYLPIQHKVELFGFLGGLINTQAIIGSLMNVYKQNKKMFQNVASGFILINTAMYLRNFILITIIAPLTLLYVGIPLVLVLATLIPFSRLFLMMKHREAQIRIDSPFGVWAAAKLGLAILLVFIILDFSRSLGGNALLITAVLGGLVYSLAVCVSLGTLALNNVITAQQAALAFILANAASVISNFFVLYVTGGKDMISKVSKAMFISVVVSILGVFLSIIAFGLS